MIPLLLATATTHTSYTRLALPLAGLLVLTGILLGALSYYRRKMHTPEPLIRDFTLSDLRQLHREGKLTDEEFDRAKSRLVSSVQNKLAKEARPTAPHAEPLNAELKSHEE